MSTNQSCAQPLQKIYSNLDNATSIYATQNDIYVIEQGKNRLLRLNHSGKLQDTIGGKGSGDYQFSKPVDVDATNGLKIFISDYNNRRIQVFDRRGQFLSSLSPRNSFGTSERFKPAQITVNNLGELFIVDENRARILQFDPNFNFKSEFRISSEVRSYDELIVFANELLLLDRETESLHRISLNGNYLGFYPAKGVFALVRSGKGLVWIYQDKFIFEGVNGDESTTEYGMMIEAIDAHIQDQTLFILTKEALYKLPADLP